MAHKDEFLDIVNEKGNPTGEVVLREKAHSEGILHGASHVYIYCIRDKKIQVLLQRRSDSKDSYPGCLDISSAGHMEHGMGYIETALKELREELGVTAEVSELKECFSQLYYAEDKFHNQKFINREFNRIYILERDIPISDLQLQKEEVSEAVWLEAIEVSERLDNNDKEICIDKEEFDEVLNFINVMSGSKKVRKGE